MVNDRFEHALGVVEHVIIPEPLNAIPLPFKPRIAFGIRNAFRVLPAIHLDNEFVLVTNEIDDISTDWHLALELETLKSVGA